MSHNPFILILMYSFMKNTQDLVFSSDNDANKPTAISPFILKKMNTVNKLIFTHDNVDISENLDLITISQNIIISGVIWKNRTEKLSKRNNYIEIKNYLDENYKNTYLLYRFNATSLNENFGKKMQNFPELEYNFINIMDFCRSVKQWFDLNKDNIIIVEQKYNNNLFSFYILCMMKYSNVIGKIEDGIAILKRKGFNCNVSNNLIAYFNSVLTKKDSFQLYIHQIIVTTLPKTISGSNTELSKFEILENNNIIHTSKADMMNEDYIIVNFNNITVKGDCKVKFYYDNSLIFVLYFNSFVFGHDLFRFIVDDLVFPSENVVSKNFDNDFSVDIVFHENKNIKVKSNYEEHCAVFIFLKYFIVDVEQTFLHSLVSEGYNKYYAKLALLVTENFEEAKKLLTKIDKPQVTYVPEKEFELSNVSILDERPYCNIDFAEDLSEIEPITDFVIPTTQKTKKRILPPKPNKINLEKKNIVAKKPFYWTIVTKTPESIFSEMDNINILIDYNQFEEWFCESLKNSTNIKKIKKPLLTKKMFLTSLAVKTLEKKKFDFNKTSTILNCQLEDIKLLLTIIPQKNEIDEILKISECKRSNIENAVLSVYKNETLIKILLFEREFFSEYQYLSDNLQSLINVLKIIIDDYNLRIILKAVLELGNTINFKYSNFRKNANAYKLSSLLNTKEYKGNRSGQNLLSFLVLTLKHNYNISPIFKNLKELKKIKTLELHALKDRMNQFIFYYKDSLQLLENIPLGKEKETIISFLKYFKKVTKDYTKQYKEYVLFSSLVKRKFGEDEKCNIMEIISILYDFLEVLEREYV
ncbi:Formin-like protein [Spraguea lophii 42_110]|uniref:Formin-like protein n=1 Tax=Spraguea lophii (strain 42_110) TaxID=1358809 RepID=S7W8F4_SPRLO|nr:Formin-like protein [Spraguea lophii 42_110]